MRADHLQAQFVLGLIKSRRDLSAIHTVEQLKKEDVFDTSSPILLRLASECLFGVFGDSHCDCEVQRVASLREIDSVGQGLYLHLPQEAQGNGLFYKAQELQIQVAGFDPSGQHIGSMNVEQAAKYLLGPNQPLDKREYTSVARFFTLTGLNRYPYNMIGDSPDKHDFLRKLDIKIACIHEVRREITIENAGEYLSKLYMKGYSLTDQELIDIHQVISSAEKIPGRILSLLGHITEDISVGGKFRANQKLIQAISKIPEARGIKYEDFVKMDLLRDAKAYDEYQIELKISLDQIDTLFKFGILRHIESLRFEENHFYDLAYLKGVPARSLKIRYAYPPNDLEHPTECRYILKIPLPHADKTYRIKSIPMSQEEIDKLLRIALHDYERHVLRVLTHSVTTTTPEMTTLIKRYSPDIYTLSLMGDEVRVREFQKTISKHISAEEIDDPSNYRFIDHAISVNFDYGILVKEEMELYRKYCFST